MIYIKYEAHMAITSFKNFSTCHAFVVFWLIGWLGRCFLLRATNVPNIELFVSIVRKIDNVGEFKNCVQAIFLSILSWKMCFYVYVWYIIYTFCSGMTFYCSETFLSSKLDCSYKWSCLTLFSDFVRTMTQSPEYPYELHKVNTTKSKALAFL